MSQSTAKAARQRIAEGAVEDFRRNLGPFVVAAETSRSAMVFTNAAERGYPIVFVNDAFLTLTGYDRDELLGQRFDFLLARGPNHDARARLEMAFSGEAHEQLEICDRRRDGSTFWASISINPVCDDVGAVVQHFSSFIDVSETKREAEHLRFLLDELNHRTQNTLATVLAISAQTLRAPVDRAGVEAFEGRILALAKAHGLLGRNHWDAVSLRDVLEQVLTPFGLNNGAESRITVQGDDVCFRSKGALTLAAVFHELATNALKFGGLSRPEGAVAIAWRIEPSRSGTRICLSWKERGGPPVVAPSRKGFGSRLIERGLAQDLDAEVHLTYEAKGLLFELAAPAERAVSQ